MLNIQQKLIILGTVSIFISMFCGAMLWASSGEMKYIPPEDPLDPNDTGMWCYYYTNDANEVTIVKNPHLIPKWTYYITNDPNEVIFVYNKIPYAEKIKDGRWIASKTIVKRVSHPKWLEHLSKHWVTVYDIRDFSLLSKHWTEKAIVKPVYYRKTSKRYHLKSCRYVAEGEVECISLEEAKKKGLLPCSVCNPYKEVSEDLPEVTDPNSVVEDPNNVTPSLLTLNVWVKEGEEYYHLAGGECAEGTKEINIITAILQGYSPCPICNPNEHLGE